MRERAIGKTMIKNFNKHKIMPHWPSLNIGCDINIVNIVIVLTAFSLLDTAVVADCPEHTWWDHRRDACIRCTVCEEQFVRRPCQFHEDTICGTFDDLGIDLSFLGEPQRRVVEPDWTETIEEDKMDQQSRTADDIMWLLNWQTVSLALAAISCVLFFIVAACIFWQHTRYWKKMERMERGFDADAEELSSRLMHTIIDIRNDENGRVILEEARKDQIVNPLDLRCVYLEQLLENNDKSIVTKPLLKNNERKRLEQMVALPSTAVVKDISKKDDAKHSKGRGNCYIEPTQQRDNCVVSELYLIT